MRLGSHQVCSPEVFVSLLDNLGRSGDSSGFEVPDCLRGDSVLDGIRDRVEGSRSLLDYFFHKWQSIHSRTFHDINHNKRLYSLLSLTLHSIPLQKVLKRLSSNRPAHRMSHKNKTPFRKLTNQGIKNSSGIINESLDAEVGLVFVAVLAVAPEVEAHHCEVGFQTAG